MTEQEYRWKFIAIYKGAFNTSCYVNDTEIRSFADPNVEQFYKGWKAGFILGSEK